MRPLTEITQILNTLNVLNRLHPFAKPHFFKLRELTSVKTQEDRNLVLRFICTACLWNLPEGKELELDLIRHMQASSGQPLLQIYRVT